VADIMNFVMALVVYCTMNAMIVAM
jgi:hypothetical protein